MVERICHCICRYNQRPSGIRTAVGIYRDLSKQLGFEVDLVSTAAGDRYETTEEEAAFDAVEEANHQLGNPWGWAASLSCTLERRIQTGSLVHAHNLWMYPGYAAWKVACRRNVPLVISLHGMLEPERLLLSPWKKRFCWWTYGRRLLEATDGIWTTGAKERRNILRQFPKFAEKVYDIPLGAQLPESLFPTIKQIREQKRSKPRPFTGLFLSRISEIKGLDLWIEAVARVRPKNWTFRIVGPDEGGLRERLQKAAQENGVGQYFQWDGAIAEEHKWRILAEADLLFLPSRNENFGLVVAEALAVGTPVLTTTGTPWEDLEPYGCGWQVRADLEGLVHGLIEMDAVSGETLQQMGENGERLQQQRYSYAAIGKAMKAAYEQIGGSESG